MSKKAKLLAYLNGESNKIPYSFWTHLPQYDLDPKMLASKTYEFYKNYDLAFIKTMPNGMFAIEDFGCECDYSEIEKGGVAKVTKMAVSKIEDWDKITPLDVTKSNAYARELSSIKMLKELLGSDDVPVLATEFSPFTIADKLSKNLVREHIKQDPQRVERALKIIADCVIAHANECIKLGCAGIFFAQQMAQAAVTSEEEYLKFGAKWDKYVLERIENAYFNVVHVHGEDIHFDAVLDYPAQGISFHAYETKPEIKDFMAKSKFVLVGGIERGKITNQDRSALAENIKQSVEDSQRGRIILTPGCVIRYPVDEATIKYCIQEVEKYEF